MGRAGQRDFTVRCDFLGWEKLEKGILGLGDLEKGILHLL